MQKNVKPNRSMRFLLSACTVYLASGLAMSQEEETDEEGAKPEISVDTLGKLAGHMLTLIKATTYEMYARGNERYETEFTLSIRVPDREAGPKAMQDESLIGWAVTADGNGIDPPWPPKIEANKNILKIYCGTSPAEFNYGKEGLVLSPAFHQAVIKNLDNPVNPYEVGCLQEVLAGSSLADPPLLNTFRLYVIRDSIRAGFLDAALNSLGELSSQAHNESEAPDVATVRYCKRLSDSIIAAKQEMQPLKLEGAKRVGKIVSDPIYPPNEKPTVFWKDDLLAVVQEDSKPVQMRTFDPKSGKWGKLEPVRYPETDILEVYQNEAASYDSNCPHETTCWRKGLGEASEDPCGGLDCTPLIMLKEANGGDLGDIEHRKRAGGASAAGEGQFEFFEQGWLGLGVDDKVSWTVLPGNALFGSREYPSGIRVAPPVVVSPDQKWIAYALAAKQGEVKELWVAKLIYKD